MPNPDSVWVVSPDWDELDDDPYVFKDERTARSFARSRGQDPDVVVTMEPTLDRPCTTCGGAFDPT